MPVDQLDLQAVAKADERFWAKHPEVHRRALTSDPSDASYRSEWLKLYEQAELESAIPAPSVLPKPVPPPPPVNATSPVQVCPAVASMTHEEKMEAAIHSANLGEDVLRELGDIKTLVATMVIVGGGLAVAGVAAAATGVGLLVESVAAVGAGLLVAGAAMSGWQIGQGLTSLFDFFQQTRCDTATTPAQLHAAGQKFGEGVAKVGIGTINLLLAVLGGRGKNWRGQALEPHPETGKLLPGPPPEEPPPPKLAPKPPPKPNPFDELAARRQKMGLPPTTALPNEPATLAKLEIGGQSFDGANSANQNPKTPITLERVNPLTMDHAEAEATQKAVNAGMTGRSKVAEMWIDRPPCKPCGQSGGLRSLARNLGVDKLMVHYLNGGEEVTVPVTPTK